MPLSLGRPSSALVPLLRFVSATAVDAERMAVALAAARRGARLLSPRAGGAAACSADDAGVPVGAALFSASGELLSRAANGARGSFNAHAESRVLRAHLARSRAAVAPAGASLYVTCEPCLGCLGAASLARVARLVFAARSPKFGAFTACGVGAHARGVHTLDVAALAPDSAAAAEASALMQTFFRARRARGPRQPPPPPPPCSQASAAAAAVSGDTPAPPRAASEKAA
jgi:tRNA(adenine34) deaminase